MKKIYLFGVLFSMVLGSLALTACGGSDDDNSTPAPPAGPTSIVANWEGQACGTGAGLWLWVW